MKAKYSTLLFAVFALPFSIVAQRGLTELPELEITVITGAPILSAPKLIASTKNEVSSQGHGLASPAFYDWNGDGVNDLLIGEYGSGVEFGRYMGSFIRVYINTGSESEPEFDMSFDYARPPFQYENQAHGTPYSINQSCCMSFTPQFIDLNNDGYLDMITGHYQGEVSWFRGSEDGFMAGEVLAQAGNPRDPDRKQFIKNQRYWLYAAASFGDLTGDSLPDLIVGGLGGLRISKNIGIKTEPKFTSRELLLSTQGEPLKVYSYSSEEQENNRTYIAGDYKLSPYVVDWDNDGVLDLLVTNAYNHKGLDAVTFFRGMKVNNEHRFESGIPLFTAKDGGKALPGSSPVISVADWNNDGINDLLIGMSVVTINGEFNDQLSWNWENDMELHGAGKDPANLSETKALASQMKWYKEAVKLPEGISFEDYMTIRHKGYVYVMLGASR